MTTGQVMIFSGLALMCFIAGSGVQEAIGIARNNQVTYAAPCNK